VSVFGRTDEVVVTEIDAMTGATILGWLIHLMMVAERR
jgi:hypothetical protein